MWSVATVLLVIAGVILVPYNMALGAGAFVLAFVAAGAAYAAPRDLETFMGLCLICGAISGLAVWLDKLL